MKPATFDMLVIGGGINGAGIARDAAGRGLRVCLVEMSDLGSATSSASTKLIHGGLRYLEHREFRLVRHALEERERLWAIAPHIIWPLRFVLPHRKGLRPAWLLRLGLLIYDNLGGRKLLPPTKTVRLESHPVGAPLRDVSSIAFEYSDCWVQDNRLVVLNARDAESHGADIRVRTRCVSAQREGSLWKAVLEDTETGIQQIVQAKVLVNAAGPWVGKVLSNVVGLSSNQGARLVKGSHIVVDKLYDHDRCYIFQNPDGRIFFAIPYEQDFTLVGTTDSDYKADPAAVHASHDDIAYLVNAANSYFKNALTAHDVIWSYAGVRALYDNGASSAQETTRDYVLRLEGGVGRAPILSVFGGKITTYRCLAEEALDKLGSIFPAWLAGRGWTSGKALPGGDFRVGTADELAHSIQSEYPFLTEFEVRRFVRHYGTETREILGKARNRAALGREFGGYLTEAEVNFSMTREYARTAEDIVWRRTKSGLRMRTEDIEELDVYLRNRRKQLAAAYQAANTDMDEWGTSA
jgi:glycerol-3-phosphate dehydrogenase